MKLALGTVQFGLNYGINNSKGIPNQDHVNQMLNISKSNNIIHLDTSINYGKSLDALGVYSNISHFKISSKFSSKDNLNLSIEEQVHETLKKVQSRSLSTYYFHHFPDCKDAKLLNQFIRLKEINKIENIGVSIYTIDELEEVIQMGDIDCVQLPFNLLDRSILKQELIQKAKDRGLTIIARSVFLQGLFFKEIPDLPEKIKPLAPALATIKEIVRENKISITELCLGYVLSHPLIDQVLIGVESPDQLDNNIKAAKIDLPNDIIEQIENIDIRTLKLLNPGNWK